MRFLFISAAVFTLSACQTVYKPPTEGTSTATLKFDMSYGRLAFGRTPSRSQEYYFVENKAYCEKPVLVANGLIKRRTVSQLKLENLW